MQWYKGNTAGDVNTQDMRTCVRFNLRQIALFVITASVNREIRKIGIILSRKTRYS